MPEQNNETWQKSLSLCDNSQRLSLEDFLTILRKYSVAIILAQENLQSAYAHLNTQVTIQDDQYTSLIPPLRTIDSSVRIFSQFLDQRTLLPITILSLRYQLMTELISMKEEIWMILALIGSLCSHRQTSPKERSTTRYKLLQKLNSLLQESKNIVELSQIMSDQARFQESRNENLPGTNLSSKLFRLDLSDKLKT